MEKNKYIVINSEDIQKRIEELKKPIAHYDGIYVSDEQIAEYEALEEILSKGKPLTPIIENALKEGMLIQRTINDKVKIPATRIKDYINNLKLDI